MTELSPENPWPGLSAFLEGDAAFFHGRDQELSSICRLVKRDSLTVLYGRSGLGKTSLLRAGLCPRLRGEAFLPVLIRLTASATLEALRAQVLERLATEAARTQIEIPDPIDAHSLWEYFHRVGAEFWSAQNHPVVPILVFDQFEEFVLLQRTGNAHAQDFLAELADLVENRPSEVLKSAMACNPELAERFLFLTEPCKVVLAFREEVLADINDLRGHMPSLRSDGRFRLMPMSHEQALGAVVRSAGHLVTYEVAEHIVHAAAGARDEHAVTREVEPHLLSMICTQLNDRRLASNLSMITTDLVVSAGGQVLSDFYESTVRSLEPQVRWFLEDNLISATGYRNSLVVDDVMRSPGMSDQVLRSLVDRRLVRLETRMGVERVELMHDVLAGVMRASRDQRRATQEFPNEQGPDLPAAIADYLQRQAKQRRQRSIRVSTLITASVILGGVLAATIWFLSR